MSEGWRFSGEEPMFIPRDEMKVAHDTFDREVAEALAKGEHYILAIVGFKVDVTEETSLLALNHENLRVPPNLGCFICEMPLTRNMNPHCPGEPVD